MLYTFIKNLLKCIYSLTYRIEISGHENIPIDGGAVICPNHKSNNDAVIVTIAIKRKLTYLGKEELFSFKPLGWIFKKIGAIPIKRGSGDIGAVRKAVEVLKDGNILIIFPEGTRNKKGYPLLEFKSGASLIAYKAGSPVIPCAIIGNYRPFSKIKISFGKPINTVFDSKPDLHILTEEIKTSVSNMLEEK